MYFYIETLSALYRHMYLLNFPPVVTFSRPTENTSAWIENHISYFSAANRGMLSNFINVL